MPPALPATRVDVLTGLRVEEAPQVQHVIHLKIMTQVRQLVFLSGNERYIHPFIGKGGAELIRVMNKSTAAIGLDQDEVVSTSWHKRLTVPDRVLSIDQPAVQY